MEKGGWEACGVGGGRGKRVEAWLKFLLHSTHVLSFFSHLERLDLRDETSC